MNVFLGLAFTIFNTSCVVTCSKKKNFEGLFIVSIINLSGFFSISSANFDPTLTKKY